MNHDPAGLLGGCSDGAVAGGGHPTEEQPIRIWLDSHESGASPAGASRHGEGTGTGPVRLPGAAISAPSRFDRSSGLSLPDHRPPHRPVAPLHRRMGRKPAAGSMRARAAAPSGTDPAPDRGRQASAGRRDMDWHTDWTKAKQELSEASKRYTVWASMPDDVRSRMSDMEYRRRRSQARQALKRADALCRSASIVARQAARSGSVATGA